MSDANDPLGTVQRIFAAFGTGQPFHNEWNQKYVVRDNLITRMVEYKIQVDPQKGTTWFKLTTMSANTIIRITQGEFRSQHTVHNS